MYILRKEMNKIKYIDLLIFIYVHFYNLQFNSQNVTIFFLKIHLPLTTKNTVINRYFCISERSNNDTSDIIFYSIHGSFRRVSIKGRHKQSFYNFYLMIDILDKYKRMRICWLKYIYLKKDWQLRRIKKWKQYKEDMKTSHPRTFNLLLLVSLWKIIWKDFSLHICLFRKL